MMLEARVRTEEAIEATVCVEARALRRDWKSVSAFSCCVAMSTSCQSLSVIGLLLPLRQNFQMMNVMMAMAAIPPMTPPAMAPTLVESVFLAPAMGSTAQPTDAQASQVSEVWTHTWPDGQTRPSQESASLDGHTTHRLSRWKMFSMSLRARADMVVRLGVWRGGIQGIDRPRARGERSQLLMDSGTRDDNDV